MPATYEPIANYTATGTVSNVQFNSIPNTYTDLLLRVSAQVNSSYDILAMRVNNITTGSYSKTYIQGNGSGVTSGRATADIRLRAGYIPGSSLSQFSMDIYHFNNYSNTTTNKTVLCNCAAENTNGNSFNRQLQVSLVPTTSAISSLYFETANGASFTAGSSFILFGIKAA